jgi:hypothetical protein
MSASMRRGHASRRWSSNKAICLDDLRVPYLEKPSINIAVGFAIPNRGCGIELALTMRFKASCASCAAGREWERDRAGLANEQQ